MIEASKVDSRAANAVDASVEIRVLGPMEVETGGQTVSLTMRKAVALLAYLSRRTGQRLSRETLSGILWADSGDEQARASLRQALSSLRKALGDDGASILIADTQSVTLQRDGLLVDASSFEELADGGSIDELEAADELYRGDFLEGLPPVSPEFDRWLDAERGGLRSQYLTGLLRLTDAYEADGRIDQMIATAQRLLAHDPLQEHVHRRLIQAFFNQRRFDAALKQFATIQSLLVDELGVSPERPTLDLVKKVQQSRSASSEAASPKVEPAELPESPTQVVPGRPSIAVLPFRSLSEDQDAEFFGEGIAEDVIIELAREPSLMVVSRHSSFQLASMGIESAELGEKLGVRFALSGSIRTSGQRMRVTAHLIRCQSGEEIWAERFDRQLEDLFAVQTEIARTVTATVVGQIEEAEVLSSATETTGNLESYLLVLRGLREMHELTAKGMTEATSLFEKATQITPDSARAWGLLAMSIAYQRWMFDVSSDVEDTIPIGERAVMLDKREAKGHCALGLSHTIKRRFDQARYHFEAGVFANPNDDLLLIEQGRFMMYVDRPEDGLLKIREALRLNPYHPSWYWNIQGRCLHTLGRHDEALASFNRIVNPPFYVYASIAACHAVLGNLTETTRALTDLHKLRPDFDLAQYRAIFPYQNAETSKKYFDSLEKAFDMARLN